MLKKLFLLISVMTISVFSAELSQRIFAELQVDTVKVMGRARGLVSEKEILQQRAMFAALKNPTDILVETDFFYEEFGDSLIITITGFSARHVVIGRLPEIANISIDTPLAGTETTTRKSSRNYFYFSANYVMARLNAEYYSEYRSDLGRWTYQAFTENLRSKKFSWEIGGIHRRGFTAHGIFDVGDETGGFGAFLGYTSVRLQNKIFRLKGGAELGIWREEFSQNKPLRNTPRITADAYTFGGPSIALLVGHEPIFLSISFKTHYGFYDSEVRGMDYYGEFGFASIPKWNIGIAGIF
ncbi:MAG: hypothetical protein FWE23_04085 [Chitinivibrionia bacterium]|nr:hypothetical protein [Chitinivibrionia bacterium]